MLFKLGFHNKSPVELLLENDDCTLEQILDEDDVIAEAKAHYGKLIEFLGKSENLTKMIDFITIEIPLDQLQNLKNQSKIVQEDEKVAEESDQNDEVHINEEKLQKRIYKYPRIAAEILCCDIDSIYTSISSDKLLLTSLFDFISHEKETLNPQLTNYWIRVVTYLVQRKPIEVHKFIMSQGEPLVLNFCKHIGVPGMDELLLKLISCELYDLIISAETNRSAKQQLKLRLMDAKDNSDATNIIKQSVQWWTDSGVPFKLIEKLSPEHSSDCHINVTKILSEIIRRSLQYNLDIQKLNPLATSILSDSVLCKLMDTLLENNDVLNEGIALLHTLIDTSVDLMDADFDEQLPSAIKVILTKLPQLVKLLENPPTQPSLTLTFGTLSPPLGETRLKVVEFLSSLYHIRCELVEKALISSNVLGVVINLFFQYEFNNMLHNLLLNIISFILASESHALKKNLFVDCQIIERILQASKLNEQAIAENKMRKGYMGHLTVISNTIVSTANSDEAVSSLTKDISGWKDFVETSLTERNAIESRQMGSDDSYLALIGGVPLSSSSANNTHQQSVTEYMKEESEEDPFEDFDDEMEEQEIEPKQDASTKESSPLSETVTNNDGL
ncbi:SAPS domain-containing protein [Naegleria gruberi]|uniref:SAPS domain-containing protein n=1 Tax=Naegleria gruberi TaxID=5762 RepID=D2VBZ7_NAEGR|nr:SAPS domain-containing protein [Naegleria gruberi]EFC45663.1 SAPS domain-containing protein [Naegleria gruberi]|eukprot:XP_002678407.1 SAPS domain-containing protein [Naegleria gruberi strain NEG-M]